MPDINVAVEDDTIVEIEVPEEEVGVESAVAVNGVPAPKNGAGAQTGSPPVRQDAADQAAAKLTEAGKKLEEERRRREAAETTAMTERQRAEQAARIAAQRETEAAEARAEVATSQIAAITSGIESAERALQQAKLAFKSAHEAGDADKMADAQAEIGTAAADLSRLKGEKVAFEIAAKRVTAIEGRVDVPRVDPFEQYVSGFPPAPQAWLRAHRECVPAEVGGNATKNAAMMEGHYAALRQGYTANSDDYFRVIEEHTGHRTPVSAAAETIEAGAEPASKPQPQPQQRQRQPIPAAPVSRETTSAGGQRQPDRIALDAAQQEIALLSFPAKAGEDDAAHRKRAFGVYARELVAAKREGKIGRMTH